MYLHTNTNKFLNTLEHTRTKHRHKHNKQATVSHSIGLHTRVTFREHKNGMSVQKK